MSLSTQPYKGANDYYPEDTRQRKWIFDKWRSVCQSFGYEEYDGPTLEPLEMYTAKTSQEIVSQQTYSFTDRGDRKVVMRPEMTPTISRMVAARRQELPYPARLFSIANFFRYERPQRGRAREFWQLNADVFGIEGVEADAEMIMLADSLMKAFGAPADSYKIKVNSRNFIKQRAVLAEPTDPDLTPNELLRVLDGWNKNQPAARDKISHLFKKPEVIFGMMEYQSLTENESIFVDELKKLLKLLKETGIKTVEYDPAIARGFDYYTDIVFEVFDTNPENSRSLFGGGRYDGLVAEFDVAPVPTVGFAVGDVTFSDFLKTHQLLPELRSETDIRAILIGDIFAKAQSILAKLRESGVNVAVDSSGRKLDTQIKHAVKSGVRYALFIGDSELNSNRFKLRDLEQGQEEELDINQIIAKIHG